MKALLFIFLFLFVQEPVKKAEPKQAAPVLEVDKEYSKQNQKLDSIIATMNAYSHYGKDTIHTDTITKANKK